MNRNIIIIVLFFAFVACSNDATTTGEQMAKPIAVADSYTINQNTSLIINDMFDNDTIQTTAFSVGIDKSTLTNGVLVVNGENYVYTPKENFVGTDTFTYTVCNDKAKKYCATATVTIKVFEAKQLNVPASLANYYKKLSVSTNKEANKQSLKSIISNYTVLSYGQRHNFLYKADKDLSNTDNVLLMYTGESRYWKEYTSGNNSHTTQTFNTEHIYPQSKLTAINAKTDLHHLRSCDAVINSNRSNHPFTDGAGSYKLVNDASWYPGDDWRGDVARMVLYLNVVHNESFDKVGSLNLFLKWNIEDPVSEFEIQRNNEIEKAQKNRNPFIDNPYLATLIYGGADAENKWK